MTKNIKVVIPVFNDWEALKLLLENTRQLYTNTDIRLSFLIVNDSSTLPYHPSAFKDFPVEVIHLIRNIGHQRAIAIGLSYLAHNDGYDKVIVMDGDGEDKPEDIAKLVARSDQQQEHIIFAERSKRSEGPTFRIFYFFYRLVFKMLTGKAITFGNFCIIPENKVKKTAFVSEIWNNFPGGVIRSRLLYSSVPINRGKRLAGKSKMNFVSLILHGLSAVSVLFDTAAVRILIFVSIMIGCSAIGTIIVLYLKFIANEATPGWASSLILAFFTISLQGFFISLFILFNVLNTRTSNNFIPLEEYGRYIDYIE